MWVVLKEKNHGWTLFFFNGTIERIMLFTEMGSMVGGTGLRIVLEFLTWLSWRGLLCNLNRKLDVVV